MPFLDDLDMKMSKAAEFYQVAYASLKHDHNARQRVSRGLYQLRVRMRALGDTINGNL